MKYSHVLSLVCAALAFLLPWWPLSLVSIVLMSDTTFFAVLLGLLFDAVYGAPIGLFSPALVPFTFFAALVSYIRTLSSRYMFSHDMQETL